VCRAFSAAIIALCFAGCQLPAERQPLRPLLEDSPPLPYAELLTRARYQATAATEAFYVNRWGDLEELGRGLEQTARFLKKATEVPANLRDKLPAAADALDQEAVKLIDAAKAQNAQQVNEIMQRINLKVRDLRLDG
jgi:hypothetical protein